MKILYIVIHRDFSLDKDKIGGQVAHMIGVVDALKKKGHQIVFCTHDKLPFYNSKMDYRMLKYRNIMVPFLRWLYSEYFLCSQIRNVIEDVKPDLVYVRWDPHLFWNRIFKNRIFKNRKYNLVFECNTPMTMYLGKDVSKISSIWKMIYKYMDNQICKSADVISAISEEVRDFLVRKFSSNIDKKIVVNPNGVDCSKFEPEGDDYRKKYGIFKDDVAIGFAAGFRPWQGIDVLIDSFQSLKGEKYKNTKLLLIGTCNPDYLNQLKELAARSRTDNIIFTGPVSFNEMPANLRTCDILVSPQNPSIGKVFHQSPIKLYEYMAAGRAIVVSNIGQLKEVIKDGNNGLIFECGRSDLLAEKIKLLIDDKPLRERIARNARSEAVKYHSWTNHVDRFLEAIDGDNK